MGANEDELSDEVNFRLHLKVLGGLSDEDRKVELGRVFKEAETGVGEGFSEAYIAEYNRIKSERRDKPGGLIIGGGHYQSF